MIYKKEKNLLAIFLTLVMFFTGIVQSADCLFSTTIPFAKNDTVDITTIDDNHAELHYNNSISENKNVLFTKEKSEQGFRYTISDMDNQKELLNFSSTQNIDLNQNQTENNSEINAVAWAIFDSLKHGSNVWNELAKIGGPALASAAAPLVGTIGSLIAECGIASIPAIIGLLAASDAVVLAAGGIGIA